MSDLMGSEFEEMDITCMICGENCETWEEVDSGEETPQIWCWCDKCSIDTFHSPKYKSRTK